MSNLNLLEMTNDIHNFIKKFEYKYGLTVDIRIGVKKSQITYNKNSLRVIEAAIISKMHEDHPTLSHITSFKNRARATRIMKLL